MNCEWHAKITKAKLTFDSKAQFILAKITKQKKYICVLLAFEDKVTDPFHHLNLCDIYF